MGQQQVPKISQYELQPLIKWFINVTELVGKARSVSTTDFEGTMSETG
jgi:hypothetical protein